VLSFEFFIVELLRLLTADLIGEQKFFGECIFFIILVIYIVYKSSFNFFFSSSSGRVEFLYFYSTSFVFKKLFVIILFMSLKFCKTFSLGFSNSLGINVFNLLVEFNISSAFLNKILNKIYYVTL
jgi:hypothetical protein